MSREILQLEPPPCVEILRRHRIRLRFARRYVPPNQLAFPGFLLEPRPRWPSLAEIDASACKALWAHVLITAVRSFICDEVDSEGNERDEDAKLWILDSLDSDNDDVGTFRYVCHVLGLDADATRDRILGMEDLD